MFGVSNYAMLSKQTFLMDAKGRTVLPKFDSNGPGKNQGRSCHGSGEWHQNHMVATVLLAASFGAKSLKKILIKSGCAEESRRSEADLLLDCAYRACQENPAARKAVEKALNAKYQSSVSLVRKLGQREILAHAQGGRWPVPLLWGCFQRSDPEARQAGRRLANRIILDGRIRPREKGGLDLARERMDALITRNRALTSELDELKRENNRLATRLQRLGAQSVKQAKPQRVQASAHKKQAKQLRRELAAKNQETEQLRHQVAVWRSLALRRDENSKPAAIKEPMAEVFPAQGVCERCHADKGGCRCEARNQCPLSGRRVAVIGGLERLEKGYSQVVEKMGGKCIFHPGHTASGMARLRKAVSGSDLVVYLTPINSHGAMSVVKKQCKRCNTPFCPLNGTSVSALESHLSEITHVF